MFGAARGDSIVSAYYCQIVNMAGGGLKAIWAYARTREITIDASEDVVDKLYAAVQMNFDLGCYSRRV